MAYPNGTTTPDSAWDDDSEFPATDWRGEVSSGDTRLGYHAWVEQQADRAREDADEGCDCGEKCTPHCSDCGCGPCVAEWTDKDWSDFRRHEGGCSPDCGCSQPAQPPVPGQ